MRRLISLTLACWMALPASAAELFWDFEDGIPGQYFTTENWGERDTTFAHGPRAPFDSGGVWIGTPEDDIAEYPGELVARLTTTEIDLPSMAFSAFYVSWVQWADFEGVATNFDGVHLLISTSGGVSWEVVDDPPEGALQPAYDDEIAAGGGTPLSGNWAYCHDTCPNQDECSGAGTPAYHLSGRAKPLQTAGGGELIWKSVASEDLIARGYLTPSDHVMLQWLFAADQHLGGEGYFIDDVRIADTPETTEDYSVSALVERVCADVDPSTVFLHYYSDAAPDTAELLMNDDGGGNFSAAIPAQPIDTDVWYWVSASDVEQNAGRSATLTFEVTKAITLILDDGQPFWIDLDFFAAENGLAAAFEVPLSPDTSYVLYKALCYFSTTGLFDLGVWDDDGDAGAPATQLFAADSTANDVTNDWWTFEFPDSILVFEDGVFYVGFTFVTGDSADNPAIAYDADPDLEGVKWRLIDGTWAVHDDGPTGETMLRVKVKVRTTSGLDGEGAAGTAPTAFKVHGNYPNPFNPRTVIRYDLPVGPGPVAVRVSVFDLAGRSVATLIDANQHPGAHSVTWSGTTDAGAPVPSGVYFYRVEAGEHVATRKMVILK